jgi:hypothetical protein
VISKYGTPLSGKSLKQQKLCFDVDFILTITKIKTPVVAYPF